MADAGLLTFAGLEAGRRFQSTRRTISETDLAMSSMLSGDWSPVHADAVFAAAQPNGRTILHGSFGIMLALGFAAQIFRLEEPVLALLGLDEWRFAGALVPGDTAYLIAEIVSTRITSSGDKGVITSRLSLLCDDARLVQEGIHKLMVAVS